MTRGFVWSHNHSADATKTGAFYAALIGWRPAPGPAGMTMLDDDSGDRRAADRGRLVAIHRGGRPRP